MKLKEEVYAVKEKIEQLLVISEVNSTQLKEHMRRTDLNENRIARIENLLLGLMISLVVAVLTKTIK